MTYRIRGLDPAPFAPLMRLNDEALAARGIVRMTADAPIGFPCRIRLDDVAAGEQLLLLNHVSLPGHGPYRASHAIFVSAASEAADYRETVPPALDRRILSLRGFDRGGMMVDAALAQPREADVGIRALLADPRIAYIHAHNAIRGCFAAAVERDG